MTMTLLQQVGGRDAVEMVVAAFYELVLADPLLRPYFRGVRMRPLMASQTDFFCAVLGDEPCYRGRDMRTVHTGMNISDAEFDAVAAHLVAALEACGVPLRLTNEIVSLVAPLRQDIVTRAPEPSPLKKSFYAPTCPINRAAATVRRAFPWTWALLGLAALLAVLAASFLLIGV
jgi:hemoglobin